MQLIFKLGKTPLLSIAEIYSVMQSKNIQFSVINADNNILYINLDSNIYPDILMKILGGTTEIFTVEDIITRDNAKKVKNINKVNIDNEKTAYGQIVAKQDIKEFEKKEINKPYTQGKGGMLPSKLAKIMLNLGITKDTEAIYDPYMGTGTILMEALIQGYKVIGSDINTDSVKGTRKNLLWTSEEFGVEDQSQLFLNDARSLPEQLLNRDENISIVTEPYLGSSWSKPVSKNVRNIKIINSIDKMIQSSIRSLTKILKNNQRLVIIIPSFKTKHDIIYLKARSMDYGNLRKISIIPENFLFESKKLGKLESFFYYREKAIVRREIFIFEKY
jgi:tRNA G10  N-methylase Trm11